MAQPGVFEWKNVSLLDDDVDGSVDLGSLIRTSRGSGRAAPHRSTDYRRRRKTDDSYDELDFA